MKQVMAAILCHAAWLLVLLSRSTAAEAMHIGGMHGTAEHTVSLTDVALVNQTLVVGTYNRVLASVAAVAPKVAQLSNIKQASTMTCNSYAICWQPATQFAKPP